MKGEGEEKKEKMRRADKERKVERKKGNKRRREGGRGEMREEMTGR